jgi:hypothetical protein
MPETIATADPDPKPNALTGVGEEDVKPNVENASSSQGVNIGGKGSTSSSTEQHQQHPAKADAAAGQAHASPKKRRKVNHGMCCAVVSCNG